MSLISFQKNNKKIKEAVERLGEIYFSNRKIHREALYYALRAFTDGFAFTIPKICPISRSWHDRNQVQSFILFTRHYASLYISLLCVRRHRVTLRCKTPKEQATLLLKRVVEYAIEHGYTKLNLEALPGVGFINYYKRLGDKCIS